MNVKLFCIALAGGDEVEIRLFCGVHGVGKRKLSSKISVLLCPFFGLLQRNQHLLGLSLSASVCVSKMQVCRTQSGIYEQKR